MRKFSRKGNSFFATGDWGVMLYDHYCDFSGFSSGVLQFWRKRRKGAWGIFSSMRMIRSHRSRNLIFRSKPACIIARRMPLTGIAGNVIWHLEA